MTTRLESQLGAVGYEQIRCRSRSLESWTTGPMPAKDAHAERCCDAQTQTIYGSGTNGSTHFDDC
jgi:hypothetical protein